MADAAPLLEVTGLGVRFRSVGAVRALVSGTTDPFIDAVIGVDFTVASGETFGLVGESGSGKTTLARALLGLVAPHAGTVRFDGAPIEDRSDAALRPMRRQMALMFQLCFRTLCSTQCSSVWVPHTYPAIMA